MILVSDSSFGGPKSADDDTDDLDDTPDDIQTIYEQVGFGFGFLEGLREGLGCLGYPIKISSDMSRSLGHVKASRPEA